MADLKPQFKGWDIKIVLLLFVCAPFTVWGCKDLLAVMFPPPPEPAGALYHLTIDPMFFILPGLFLGLIVAAVPVMAITRMLLGDRFSDYILYGNLLVGFDTVKIWATLSALFAAMALCLAAAAGSVHLTVFGDHLELRHFGSMKSVSIPSSGVASATAYTDGMLKLTFTDGKAWSSADDLGLLAPTVDQARAVAQHFATGH